MADDNIIFLNLNLTNRSPSPIPAEIMETRSTPIVSRPQDYELEVQRMQVSMAEVPLFFPIIPNPGSPLVTDMSITLTYNNTDFQQFVSVSPEEQKNGIFSINDFLQDVNEASSLAFATLKAAFPGASGTAPPLFYLDPTTSLISMYVQDSYLDSNINRITIYLNQILDGYLNLPYDQSNLAPAPNGKDYLVSVNDSAILLPAAPRTGVPQGISAIAGNLLKVSQEYIMLSEFDNVKSVVIISNLIPTVREMVPSITGSNQNSSVTSSNSGILIDFELIKNGGLSDRTIAQYIPQSEFVMKSLYGSSSLQQVDILAFYQTYDGRLFPIMLGNNTNLSIKLMFRRKFKK